jgi:plastocyanin
MNKFTYGLTAAVIATMILTGTVLASPMAIANIVTGLPTIFNTAIAQPGSGITHTISITAESLPNGQDAYKMVSHTVSNEGSTPIYSDIATIPGPTIVVGAGDAVQLTLTNNIAGKSVGFNVPGLSSSNAKTETGASKIYTFTAASAGTYLYQNKDDALLGLFGAIVVNPTSGSSVGKYIADSEEVIDPATDLLVSVTADELEREFVLFMVGSTFWGQELKDNIQTPLWTNPMLGAEEHEIVRFHVLSVGPGHTFHLHAHRWVESTTNDNIIDTRLMKDGFDTHTFIVESGADVGEGHWQYHCHVFAHMEAGMHGTFKVGTDDHPGMSMPGASPYNGLLSGGEGPGLVTFIISDEPGSWFKSARGDALAGLTVTKSLEVARPGDYVNFIMSDTDTVHTITSLLWPTGAEHMPMDEVQSYKGGGIVELTEPGLYVFTCKVHPYMFGGVIVDDPETSIELDGDGNIVPNDIPEVSGLLGNIVEDGGLLLDLGETVSLVNGYQIPTGSDLALRLTKTFFVATAPENWRDYSQATWNPSYPSVSVKASVYLGDLNGGGLDNTDNFLPVAVQNLNTLMEAYFAEDTVTNSLFSPADSNVYGVGEVWIDTQFEKTESKTKPGTATAVDVATWTVAKKVALPGYNMNNPHNMWTDKDQTVIYQTEWFSNKLSTFDRVSGTPISQIKVGEAPSHVMTRANNDDIHVALNGEEGVAEIFATTAPAEVNRIIAMQGHGQDPTHPHAHWMSSDGQKMVTPNAFTHDTTLFGFDTGMIEAKTPTGVLAIATGMKPDDSYYVVANLLSSTLSVIDLNTGAKIRDINLLGDYNPAVLVGINDDGGLLDAYFDISLGPLATTSVAALPIQTPISPDGKYMVTANTLTGNIVVTDVSDADPNNWFIAEVLPCDPGCHGVQFGAKDGGGYLAYVSSKFANDLVVIDIDESSATNLQIVGRILLNPIGGMSVYDDQVVGLDGMGGQGVMPIPNVYNGWVQNLPEEWMEQLTEEQQNPVP